MSRKIVRVLFYVKGLEKSIEAFSLLAGKGIDFSATEISGTTP